MTLLSDLTTLRVGGPAGTLVRATTRDELVSAALEAWDAGDDWLVLGGGSNVVVADSGFEGTVIQVSSRGIQPIQDGSALRVEAGESWDALVAHTVDRRLAGMEALSGIPGSVGAAPVQNIGAYGQELAQTLVSVDFLDYLSGEVLVLDAAELGLGYRTSALKRGRRGIVLSVELELESSPHGVVAYPQLAESLRVSPGQRLPLATIRSAVLALRRAKGMVLDPDDPDTAGCGSFFTNPIVGENFARSLPADAPRWPTGPEPEPIVVPLGEPAATPNPTESAVKLSAAWLIERAGVGRGFALPGSRAAISSKHTLAITNRGGATAEEVAELARYIRARVVAEFGVALQPEPVAVGVEL